MYAIYDQVLFKPPNYYDLQNVILMPLFQVQDNMHLGNLTGRTVNQKNYGAIRSQDRNSIKNLLIILN